MSGSVVHPPTVRAVLITGLGAAGATALLMSFPVVPPSLSPAAVLRWWDSVGTASASIALVHVAATLLAIWLTLAGFAAVIATRSRRGATHLWRLVPTPALRRVVGGSVLAATAATAVPAGAEEMSDPIRTDDIVLSDHGPVVGDSILLVDLGPAREAVPAGADSPGTAATPLEPTVESPSEAETWTIARGDHLWHIAEETLRDRGHQPTESEVALYWRRLIDANRDVVGADPDLVFPGQVVRLPG